MTVMLCTCIDRWGISLRTVMGPTSDASKRSAAKRLAAPCLRPAFDIASPCSSPADHDHLHVNGHSAWGRWHRLLGLKGWSNGGSGRRHLNILWFCVEGKGQEAPVATQWGGFHGRSQLPEVVLVGRMMRRGEGKLLDREGGGPALPRGQGGPGRRQGGAHRPIPRLCRRRFSLRAGGSRMDSYGRCLAICQCYWKWLSSQVDPGLCCIHSPPLEMHPLGKLHLCRLGPGSGGGCGAPRP